jgi:D-3-phosphoglycerate dehydrogenase/C-terminal binding protein
MPTRAKIVVTDFVTEPLDCERRILGVLADFTALDARHESELAGHVEDADAIMIYHCLSVGAETIASLRRCKVIVRCGVGIDNVDWAAAARCGIPVANIPDYGTEDVADTAIGMALTLARGVHFLNSRLRSGQGPWSYTQVQPVPRLRGRVFGIIGIGRIGTATALRAKAHGMQVVFYDPLVPDGIEKALGVQRAETLTDLLEQSHIVSAHCPLTPATRHLLNGETIGRMQRGSILINTARGAVVDVAAVLKALESGHLAGAGIDVLETEPPAAEHPLLQAWRDPAHPAHHRLIVNPHAAFYSEEGLMDMRIKGSENCRRALLGEALRNVVNGVGPREGVPAKEGKKRGRR